MAILIKAMEMPKNCETCELSSTDSSGFFGCCVTGNIVLRKRGQERPSWCPLTKLITIEELMEPMCDQCQWPGWYKDPDDMQREKCSDCPVEAKLMEALYDDA